MNNKYITIILAIVVTAGALMALYLWKGSIPVNMEMAVPVRTEVSHEEDHAADDEEEHSHETDADHDHEGGQEEHGDEDIVKLDEKELREFGIELSKAGPGRLHIYVTLPGEITVNADRLSHIVPRVGGVVREVYKTLGDRVRKGEVMAVLESRELADAKSAYLAARERVELAKANFRREEELWKKKISPEKRYLKAKKDLAEATIELRSAEQKLHAIGFSDEYISSLPEHPDVSFTRYQIVAPFDGTVIEKHITLGEVLTDDSVAFTIADLSTVWVELDVYQKDLPVVRKGQKVIIRVGYGIPDVEGSISYVGPVVGEETRTAIARVVLPNPRGELRPGLFVTGRVIADRIDVAVLVPKTALQTIEGKTCVFVATDEGFRPQPVTTGRSDDSHVEITSGLTPGQMYVSKGAFTLKAQLSKHTFGGGHAH